jgi:subtilisin family serine protease
VARIHQASTSAGVGSAVGTVRPMHRAMPSTFRAAIACAALILCALLPASASAAGARDMLVAHTDGSLSLAKAGSARMASAHRPGVRFVEPNYRYAAQSVPGDELFDQQWSLADDRTLGVQSAWDVTTGGGPVVAIIDTGADLTHPDLRDNLWRNPREVPGNGIDDDGNGFVDDVNGVDLVNRDGDPTDDNGHGTHVAGILAARGGNRIGVTGVAQKARIMVIKALGADSVGSALTMAEGVRYAVANGAKIINMSVSGPGRSQAFEEAVQAASAAGVLMAVAAGNSGHDLDVTPEYPAGFTSSHVIAVAATGRSGKLIGISNRGAGTVDIAAPGQSIVSTAMGGDYEIRSGTSMAAPHVAGALLLLAAARPDLGADALQAAIMDSAHHGVDVASGSLDIAGAMRKVTSAARWRAASVKGASSTKRAPVRASRATLAG